MDGIAERGIKFTLKVATDQSAKAEVAKLNAEIDTLQKKLNGIQASAESAKTASAAAATAVVASANRATSGAGGDASVMSAKDTNDRIEALLAERAAMQAENNAKLASLDAKRLEAAQSFATQWESITDAISNGEEIDMAFAQGVVEQLGQAALEAKAEYDAFQDSLTSKASKEAEKRTDTELKALKKRQAFHVAETKKMVDAELKEIERGIKAEVDARRASELAAKRAHDANMESYTQLTAKSKNSSRQLMIQFGEINESVMRFARGLTLVGLAGEEDIGKLTKGLVKAQAYFDVFSGGIKTLTKINEIYRLMTTTIQAATAAQVALNLAQGMDAGGRVIRDPLNKNPAKRGGGANVATGVASEVGGDAIGTLAAKYLPVLSLAAQKVGAAIGGAFMTVAGAGAAALGAAIFAGNGVKEMIQGRQSSFGETIGNSSFNPHNINAMIVGDIALGPGVAAARASAKASEAKTKRMEKTAPQLQSMNERDHKAIDANLESKLKIERELKSLAKERLMATLEEQKPLEKRKTIANELRALTVAAARNEAGARDEVIQWQKKRLANEREISQERAAAARMAAESAKSELDDVVKRQQVLREGVMSAAERFATLDPEQQQSILDTQNRLRRGDKSLTTEKLQEARGFGEQTDERIRTTLRGRAFGSGFGAFAKESFAEDARLEKAKRKLEVEVKQKLDFAVRIEGDYDALAKKIAVEINKQQDGKVKALGQQVQNLLADVNKLKAGISTRNGGVTVP